MKQISKFIITIFFIAFAASCKKDSETNPTSSATIVGKWNFTAIGIKTDAKTTEATVAEIKKLDNDTGVSIGGSIIEFKADGTYASSQDGDSETGKYTVSADKKTITYTSDAKVTGTYEVISLSSSEMLLGLIKSSKKDAAGDFIFANDDEEAIAYIFALIVYTAKGIADPDAELAKAKTIQVTVKLSK